MIYFNDALEDRNLTQIFNNFTIVNKENDDLRSVKPQILSFCLFCNGFKVVRMTGKNELEEKKGR